MSTHMEQVIALTIGVPLALLVFGVLYPMAVRLSLQPRTPAQDTPAPTYTVPSDRPVFHGYALPDEYREDYPGTWTLA